jgi:3-oxoacyl-[acyl-carrier protein] reductase
MNDYFIQLSKNPIIQKLIHNLGLPKLPVELIRTNHPWEERPFNDQPVVISQIQQTALTKILAETVVKGGGNPFIEKDDAIQDIYNDVGKAYGRLPQSNDTDDLPENFTPKILIFDATNIQKPEELNLVHSFFQSHLRSLANCGRVVVLSQLSTAKTDISAAATTRALEGFIRAMAREIGFKGATANIVYVAPDAQSRLEPVLRFLMSERSAYISGQPLYISKQVVSDEAIPKMRPLDGKTALVTGAARGIGASIARNLAREGAQVIIMDRPGEDISAGKLASEIQGRVLICDITTPSAGNQIVEMVSKTSTGLDIVVHNAGITRDKLLVNMKPEVWDQVLDVNFRSILRVNEKLLSIMKSNGRIVCLSSVSGIAGNRGQTNYAASKAGVIGFISALAPIVADKGIAVNAVAPGFIETQMTAKIPFATQLVARRLNNLNQGGTPGDVAETITFLCSPGASGITGQVLRICGGALIGA